MKTHISSWHAALKSKTITFCLVITAISGSIVLGANQSYAESKRILVLGDSLSAAYNIPLSSGWVNLLAQDLAPEYKVINASVSGETTGGGLSRLPALLEEHQPHWVLVELGGNDGLRGFPLKIIRENLLNIGDMVKQSGGVPIYFGIEIPPNYGPRYTNSFAGIFSEVAASHSAAHMNLFIKDFYENRELLQEDGIHPTEQAQPIIRDHVRRFLSEVLANGK